MGLDERIFRVYTLLLAICEQTALELEAQPDRETSEAIDRLTRRLYEVLDAERPQSARAS